jgi:hypothetical protein
MELEKMNDKPDVMLKFNVLLCYAMLCYAMHASVCVDKQEIELIGREGWSHYSSLR